MQPSVCHSTPPCLLLFARHQTAVCADLVPATSVLPPQKKPAVCSEYILWREPAGPARVSFLTPHLFQGGARSRVFKAKRQK